MDNNRDRRNQGDGYRSQRRDQSSKAKNTDDRVYVDDFWKQLSFNSDWITKGADKAMVEFADKAGKYMAPLKDKDKECLSKSQIRNVFGEMKRIQLKGFDSVEGHSAFMLLKPKVAYAEGRNRTKGLTLFKKVFDAGWFSVKDEVSYNNFCALLEAVLAYHKAYGGKD